MLGIILVMGITCDCLWLSKLEKEMAKALERKNDILAQLFMKLMEIRRKGR